MEKVLNIYSQPMEHMEARIVGNKAGLEELRRVIDETLDHKYTQTCSLYASDGEGYQVEIKLKPDDWFSKSMDENDLPFYHRILA